MILDKFCSHFILLISTYRIVVKETLTSKMPLYLGPNIHILGPRLYVCFQRIINCICKSLALWVCLFRRNTRYLESVSLKKFDDVNSRN